MMHLIDYGPLKDNPRVWAVSNSALCYPNVTLVTIPSYIPDKWLNRIKVAIDDRGTHYLWTGWNNGKGHAKASIAGKMVYCYRYLYQQITGTTLRRWDHIDYLCERKPCLNFDHWEKVAPGVNTERGPGQRHQFKAPAVYEAQRHFSVAAIYHDAMEALHAEEQKFLEGTQWTTEQLERFAK